MNTRQQSAAETAKRTRSLNWVLRHPLLILLLCFWGIPFAHALAGWQVATNGSFVSTAVGFGNGKFLVGGDRSLISGDGLVWAPGSIPVRPYAITYGNGMFVAVGGSSGLFPGGNTGSTAGIATSRDGTNWTVRASITANSPSFYGVIYANNLFVAVGGAPFTSGTGLIYTSSDGITWTSRPAGTVNAFSSVAYGNGRFVAVGVKSQSPGVYAHVTSTSADGHTWTQHTTPAPDQGITFGNGIFVALTDSNYIVRSTDGVNWTLTSTTSPDLTLHSVIYANGQFVAVGETSGGGEIYVSINGVDWWRSHSGNAGYYSIAYGGNQFIAVGTEILSSRSAIPAFLPAISLQPHSQIVSKGAPVTVSVSVAGPDPFTYQWLHSGTNIVASGRYSGTTSPTLTILNAQDSDAGIYEVQIKNSYGSVRSATATLGFALPLADAFDLSTTWRTGGNIPWSGQSAITHDGIDAGQSGSIGNSQASWAECTVVGPASLSFWWKVSSESGNDFLTFATNGSTAVRISGEVGWRQQRFSLPLGTHVLRWTYAKDGILNGGQDKAWLDQITFDIPAPEFTYTTNSDGITITRYTGSGGEVVIPQTINGIPVTQIGENSFGNDFDGKLTSIHIPEGVVSIGRNAFFYCEGLTNLVFPGSLTNIDESAFAICSGLKSLVIPGTLTKIGYGAFQGCTGMTNLTLLNGIATIEYSAFDRCTALRQVTIPASVTYTSAPFPGCTNLLSINVDPSNTRYASIDGVLFSKDGVELIEFPAGKAGSYIVPATVREIGHASFAGSPFLTSVVVPSSLTTIQNYAFAGCSALTAVHFSGDAPALGTYSFDAASKATIYYVPDARGWGPTFAGLPTAQLKPGDPSVLFFDNFEDFSSGANLSFLTYTPLSGPPIARVATSIQNGTPTIRASDSLGSMWALFDNSAPINKNQYKASLSSIQTNQTLKVTWKMWIQATNSGPGMFLFSIPTADPAASYNPPLGFVDDGSIIAMTNGISPQTSIGRWGSLAGTVMTNELVLDFPRHSFTYSLNGQIVTTMPLGLYFTNVVGAIYFNGFERSAGSLGNRFAIDDVKVTAVGEPPFAWAKRVAATIKDDDELHIGLAIDRGANVYVTGWFEGTADLGHGVLLSNMNSSAQHTLVAKYNSAGIPVWARSAGSANGWNAARAVGVDETGHVYVTGQIRGEAKFDNVTVAGSSNTGFFLAKYRSDGAIEWVRSSQGAPTHYGTGLAVDRMGNSHVVGYLGKSREDSPVQFGEQKITSLQGSGFGAFLIKHDARGAAKWGQAIDSATAAYCTAVTLDSDGNVYIGGNFRTSVRIGTIELSSPGQKHGFLAKLNSNGVVQWARAITGGDSAVLGLSVSSTGKVYAVGGFSETACFNRFHCLSESGAGFPGTGMGDAFLTQYDAVTGNVQWAVQAGGSGLDGFTGVTVGAQGEIYVAGGFNGFGIPNGFQTVVAAYNTNGVQQWIQSSSGSFGALSFAGPVLDAAGNCYAAGWFRSNAVFGPHSLSGSGEWDLFLTKVGENALPLALTIENRNGLPFLDVTGEIGSRFRTETTTTLQGAWTPSSTNVLTATPFEVVDESTRHEASKFYRAKLLP